MMFGETLIKSLTIPSVASITVQKPFHILKMSLSHFLMSLFHVLLHEISSFNLSTCFQHKPVYFYSVAINIRR
ncbi:hypothetical protein CHS0354_000305 [Potamilus streckersoni]|uniref:Uncharacterized protein n=1 Tax=Potamilus streckersoni TaxID=2493646 RepID=A0AAE0VLX2_9BIVA|nr:hypothetical protein CHS0354_000305 [Potamilus streckersoni]